MTVNLYVGNLSYGTNEEDLREAFEAYGSVATTAIINDRRTGRHRGFGFVEMDDGVEAAIEALNGSELDGRRLTVKIAKPREQDAGGH